MSDPKSWFEDEVEGDAPDSVEVEVEHEAPKEVPTVEASRGTGDDDYEVIYGCVRVEPGVAKRGRGGKYIFDEQGAFRKVVR